MSKTTLKQKVALILFGLLLGVVLLEIGLRIGGFIFLYFQERANIASLEEKGEYVILCLGESTTQAGGVTSYPRQLEKILNFQDIGIKFTVINKGISGTNTAHIVAGLKGNLEKYHPNMVITMMGINDGSGTIAYEDTPSVTSKLFFESFRVYKLACLLQEHIAYMINEWSPTGKYDQSSASKDTLQPKIPGAYSASQKSGGPVATDCLLEEPADIFSKGDQFLLQGQLEEAGKCYDRLAARSPDECYHSYIKLARLYHRKKDNSAKAEEYYKKAITLRPADDKAYATGGDGLISLYREQNKWKEAERLARKVIKFNPNNFLTYSELGRCYERKGLIDKALEMYNKSFDLKPSHNQPFAKLTFFNNKLGRFQEVERICNKRISINPNDDKAYAALAISYNRQGKKVLALEFFAKVDELRTSFYNRSTAQNYRKLLEILFENKIQPVCVQYPMRNINNLKKMIPDQEDILFVDNEQLFKAVLKQGNYEDYFVDQFAGDFGHCTPLGDYLLARNIAGTLVTSYFSTIKTILSNPESTQIRQKDLIEMRNLLTLEAKILTASSRNLGNQTVEKLADSDNLTFWHVSLDQVGEPAWVTIDFGDGNEKTVRALTAIPRADIPQQFFCEAKLLGSDDGVNWELVSKINQQETPKNTSRLKWAFENNLDYRYYQVLITSGHEGGKFYSMAELALFE